MRRPLTLLFALCGWLSASPTVEASDDRSVVPSIWARYALIRPGTPVEHLVVVRDRDRIEHRYLERAETFAWERSPGGEIEHLKIFARDKRAVHFTPGDLRTIAMTPHWDGLFAWLADLALPENLTLGKGAGRVELRLLELTDCSSQRCAQTSTRDLRVLEFADLGDMEHDPFARNFLHPEH